MNNFELAKVFCKCIPLTEADEVSKHITRVFEVSKMSLELIEHLIATEIEDTSLTPFLLKNFLILSFIFLCEVPDTVSFFRDPYHALSE